MPGRPLLGLALAGALCACASKGSAPAPAGPTPVAGAAATTPTKASPRNRNILLTEDLAQAGPTVGAAIERLRPEFLASHRITDRGGTEGPSLILDDDARSMEQLWSLPCDQIAFVRFFPAADAQARFGTKAGVVYVVTKQHKPNIPLPK